MNLIGNALNPKILIIDSIQTIASQQIPSPPGSLSQIREITHEIVQLAKGCEITCFIVGHVTKEGMIAGPKVLEHMVDVVIYFEGDDLGQYRMLRVIKNRFGNTNEVGIFEMRENGLVEVSNPSLLFIEQGEDDSFGRSVSCIQEGGRTLLLEIQALVVENKNGNGRRTTQGIEVNRLAMLLAVIEKYIGIPLGFHDCYLNLVGGIKNYTRDTDLAIIASILSSLRNSPIPKGVIFLGEVGLTGEIRTVPMFETRLKELNQLQYKVVFTCVKQAEAYKDKFPILIKGIKTIEEIDKCVFNSDYLERVLGIKTNEDDYKV